jgi:thiol:disulfide interchange protein DsbD
MRKLVSARRALSLVLAAVLVLVLAAADAADAGDPKTGRIDLEARLEPADLARGGAGTLIVEGKLFEKLHIYATGENKITFEPVQTPGVSFDVAAASFSPHHKFTDEMGDAFDVWEGSFTFRLPVRIASDAAPGAKVGVRFTYYGCTHIGCYPPVRKHEASLSLGGGKAAAPAPPKLIDAPAYTEGTATVRVDEKRGLVAVTFEPALGFHFYAPGSTDGEPVEVVPQKAEGVTWGKPAYPDVIDPKIEEPYTVIVPFQRAEGVNRLELVAKFAGCDDMGCKTPKSETLRVIWPSGAGGASVLDGGGETATPPGVVADEAPRTVNAPVREEGTATIRYSEEHGAVAVTFEPEQPYHFYGPDYGGPEVKVSVTPKPAQGVEWGAFKMPSAEKITEPYTVIVPVKRGPDVREIAVDVRWQGCSDAICQNPSPLITLKVTWPAKSDVPTAGPPPGAPREPKGDVLFPVVEDDDLGQGEDERSFIQRTMNESPVLAFGLIFLFGLGLAFTPCVLPIIPITVSVITGGNADIPRKRLAGLLGTYVLGLCFTFATMGVIAAQTGGAMSAVFATPAVQWGIAILFLFLGMGMFGIIELQPPHWLTKLQGGAQKHSGSFLGAFLFGCVGAVIASPCTGPAIAALLIIAANEGSVILGFSMFFVLGLGMGAVLFAAGSLNFVMRPGPWMAWVRYSFGVLIIAAAMYYLRNYQLVDETTMWIIGLAVCVLAALGITWHLTKKEGEDLHLARMRGVKVGVLTALALVLVAWYTRVPDNLLSWTYVKGPAHLRELVRESSERGKPVVVDFWGDWCTNCKVFDKRIASTPTLRERFERITRVKVDLSDDFERWPIRHALGVEVSGAPIMVFIDRQGRIRRNADVVGLKDADELAKHIDIVLRDNTNTKVDTSSVGLR